MSSRQLALLGVLVHGVAAAPPHGLGAAADVCPQPLPSSRDSVLLQTGQALAPSRRAISAHEARRSHRVTSDCASRLGLWDQFSAACLIVQSSKAMLVWVPYGSPGWDFPGGTMHSGEPACETAERETCEETGHQVRVLERLSYNVFKCEILAYGVCTNSVDEGFLTQEWFGYGDVDGLQLRPYTWGDKLGLMKTHLPTSSSSSSSPAPSPSDPASAPSGDSDVCGCKSCENYGFSTTTQQCEWGAETAPNEACACLAAAGWDMDSCGCKACEGWGWSTTAGACVWGAHTQPHEACACRTSQR